MNKPYFLGYLNSRPNEASAFTQHIEDPKEKDYQHPEYLGGRGKVRYQSRFDYYSLGLLLLELGVENVSTSKGNPEQLRKNLRIDKVPRLGQKTETEVIVQVY